jgi:hypothetical protein
MIKELNEQHQLDLTDRVMKLLDRVFIRFEQRATDKKRMIDELVPRLANGKVTKFDNPDKIADALGAVGLDPWRLLRLAAYQRRVLNLKATRASIDRLEAIYQQATDKAIALQQKLNAIVGRATGPHEERVLGEPLRVKIERQTNLKVKPAQRALELFYGTDEAKELLQLESIKPDEYELPEIVRVTWTGPHYVQIEESLPGSGNTRERIRTKTIKEWRGSNGEVTNVEPDGEILDGYFEDVQVREGLNHSMDHPDAGIWRTTTKRVYKALNVINGVKKETKSAKGKYKAAIRRKR